MIAHEFSHILNGDMRLNIRLMGVLYGILLISITGWILFRSTMYSGRRYGARSDSKKEGGNPLPLIGLALYVVGYIGVFFGNLIKSAVSRQREYLADASAVQFTRNPDGIAGALKKIGALSKGAKIDDPEAGEANHMFFGDAMGQHFLSLLATHPPLVDRIRRIDPSFDGDFSHVRLEPPKSAQAARLAEPTPPRKARMRFNPAEAVARIGQMDVQQLAYAQGLLASLPDPLTAQARDPFGARAVVFALLLDEDESIRDAQLARLAEHAHPSVQQLTRTLLPRVRELPPARGCHWSNWPCRRFGRCPTRSSATSWTTSGRSSRRTRRRASSSSPCNGSCCGTWRRTTASASRRG